jgi:glycogen operon protein
MKPGITFRNNEATFAVHSTSEQMTLLLFDAPTTDTPSREIAMKRNRGLWQITVPDIHPGQLYLYQNDKGQQLLDPCAKALHSPRHWGKRAETRNSKLETGESKPELKTPNPKLETRNSELETLNPDTLPRCVVVDDSFDWEGDTPPNTPLEKTIIYEAHLRGFTGGGSYLDFIEKIPYLQELGITAVEFLPLFEFNELEFSLFESPRSHLLNFWGYSTLGFFAPMSRYASSPEPGAAVREFKTLVKALHTAGIEIILDVVYNHTGEGEKTDSTYHFRGLDEAAYYLQDADGTYQNWSGCGNTVNANHPVAKQFIVESLKYWATEMHVDGFRFDLATSLCRGEDGQLLEHPPLIQALEKEPALKQVKLIAEAWDCGGYQVGHFPAKRFSDWNGKFRDDARRFWNHGHPIADLATRLTGSSDLYRGKTSGPLHSINFITAHDGFTLADLVSYEHKHNEANGEENRDGENQNESVNFGAEGPTDNPDIHARRRLQQKNLLATLFLSQGVPMLLAGDEFGRTQKGSNNAYCQDNDISWVDWSLLEQNKDLFEFTKQLIALRKAHPVLRRNKHLSDKDVQWLGPDGNAPDWHQGRAVGMHLIGSDEVLILINNEIHEVNFNISNDWKNSGLQAPAVASAMADRQPASNAWELELATAKVVNFTLPPHSLAVYKK